MVGLFVSLGFRPALEVGVLITGGALCVRFLWLGVWGVGRDWGRAVGGIEKRAPAMTISCKNFFMIIPRSS